MKSQTLTKRAGLVAMFSLGLFACSEPQQAAQTPAAAGGGSALPEHGAEVPSEGIVGISPTETSLIYVSNEDSNDITMISGSSHEVLATIHVGKRPRGIKVSPDGSRVYVALSGSPKCPPSMSDEDCEAQETDKSADGIAEVDVLRQQVVRILESGSDPEQFDVNWEIGRLYVSNEDMSMASILDMDSGEVIMQVETGREPEGVRVSPDGRLVYVTGEVDSDITVLDAHSGEELARIPVGLRPRDAIFTRDSKTAYVSAEFGTAINIIDVEKHEVVGELALNEGDLPMEMVLSADERTLFVANGRGGNVSAIDLDSGEVVRVAEVGPRPWGLEKSADGQYLYSANGPSHDITVLDIETFDIVTRIPVGTMPWGVVVGTVPSH